MSGQRPSGDDGQERTSDTRPSDALRHPAHPPQTFQPPHAIHQQQQPQYIQTDASDLMRMSSLHGALPNVPPQNYAPGQRYAANPYGVPPQAHAAAYHGYPQSPTQQTGMQYPTYMDQAGHPMQYSPMQQQFPGPSMYAAPPQSQPYGMYANYGPPSPVQQRGFQGQSHGFPGQEYTQPGMSSGPGSVQGSGRLGYPAGPKQPSTSPTIPAAPRGPPRKPKQSGFALWVGNLPPGTRVDDLKDHFARDATKEIESVFLISKSNCAFVNYRTEEACAAAMTRFHDSRFQGVRLVTRLRKTPGSASSPVSGPGGSIPSGPSAQQQQGSTQSQTAVEAIAQNRESSQKATEASQPADASINDKYFVVKSLTVEDLELSVRNGIWATQGHNEDALNKAYETVENVYLIFSANKSGEYFGYARMISPINDETAKDLEWKQHEGGARTAELHADPDLPRSIPTEATEWAPKGRIIDDSARGTIFWEAESDDAEEEPREVLVDGEIGSVGALKGQQDSDTEDVADSDEDDEADDDNEGPADLDLPSKLASKIEAGATGPVAAESAESSHQPFGRPFRVQWLSHNRLPFYRTRGLRNAWNANREVKIARDGTELETGVGRRLISMFHRPPGPPAQMQQAQQYMGQTPPHMGYGMPQYGGRY